MSDILIKDGILYTINDGMEMEMVGDSTVSCKIVKYVVDVTDNNIYNRTKGRWVQTSKTAGILCDSIASDDNGVLDIPDNWGVIKCEFLNPETYTITPCMILDNKYVSAIRKKILFWHKTKVFNNVSCLVYYKIKNN